VVWRVGGAAHHAQHDDPAGAQEPHDEYGGQDEEGDVEPGGVVPCDALLHYLRVALAGDQAGDTEEEFDQVSGAISQRPI
jgi:hypothetical protein